MSNKLKKILNRSLPHLMDVVVIAGTRQQFSFFIKNEHFKSATVRFVDDIIFLNRLIPDVICFIGTFRELPNFTDLYEKSYFLHKLYGTLIYEEGLNEEGPL